MAEVTETWEYGVLIGESQTPYFREVTLPGTVVVYRIPEDLVSLQKALKSRAQAAFTAPADVILVKRKITKITGDVERWDGSVDK